jgi:hypothetical protein
MYTSLTGQGEHNGTIRPIYTAFQTYLPSVRNVLTTLCVVKWRNAEVGLLRAFLCFSSPFFGFDRRKES